MADVILAYEKIVDDVYLLLAGAQVAAAEASHELLVLPLADNSAEEERRGCRLGALPDGDNRVLLEQDECKAGEKEPRRPLAVAAEYSMAL